MNRAVFGGVALVVLCVMLSWSIAFAEEKPASGQLQSQTSQAPPVREQAPRISPEERAKLREKWSTMSDEERAQARAKLRERLSGTRVQAVPQKSAADQIAALKQERQEVISQLQAIRQMAAKENAPETTKALDSLIAQREETYQKRLLQMEQRLQRVQAIQKNAGQTVLKTDPNQPTTGQKQPKAAEEQSQK